MKIIGKISSKTKGGYNITDVRNRTIFAESSTEYKAGDWVIVLNNVIVSKASKVPNQVEFSV